MRAVITGATGFIGSHVTDLLIERGYEVCCIIRPTSNLRWLKDKKVELVEAELHDQERLNEVCKGAHYIIHCAGAIAAHNLEDFIRHNKGATEHMLRAALTTAGTLKRFVHLSSMAVCGPAQSRSDVLHSTSPCMPITAYGISKLEAEKAVHNAMGRLPITIIRPPAVYGERDEATLSFFAMIPYHIVALIGFGEKWISMVHVSDLVRGLVDAMESDATIGNTYFLSSGEQYNWDHIAEVSASVMNVRAFKVRLPHSVVKLVGALSQLFTRFHTRPAVFNYEKAIDFVQQYWLCSIEEAQRDFHFQPRVDLREGLERTIQWYRAQEWL